MNLLTLTSNYTSLSTLDRSGTFQAHFIRYSYYSYILLHIVVLILERQDVASFRGDRWVTY